MAVRSFQDLRAWQSSRAFKLSIYRLCDGERLARDSTLRSQLRDAAASAVSQVAEGFGRFNPRDFARFLTIARASLIECQNHLHDAVDRTHISEDEREENDALARAALRDITS